METEDTENSAQDTVTEEYTLPVSLTEAPFAPLADNLLNDPSSELLTQILEKFQHVNKKRGKINKKILTFIGS